MRIVGCDQAASTLACREHVHRRLLLLAIASLLLLSTSPVFGHHLPLNTELLLAGIDHLGRLCVTALHLLLAPVHYGFKILIAVGLLYAVRDRSRAWLRMRRALGALDANGPVPGDSWWAAAVEAGLDPRRLRIVAGLPSPAFTAGLLSPRVYVARSLVDRLTTDELVAVLEHERAHVERRDPLRFSCLRALAFTLFWIPALRWLADDMADEAEIIADDGVAAPRRLVLAQAILALAQWPEAKYSAPEVAFYRADLLDRRIRRLAGEETPLRSHVTRRSVIGAAVVLALVWSSGVVMAHPLPAGSSVVHERHCDHRGELAVAHLFCLGSPFASAPDDCPHQHRG